ncbi:hypothetical protein Glove_82g60 [Diversispora epigaea]|uniref:Protein kinase domain-containing protein n=1 Tax=Diversispora epigaea TaxID=1348612 RepID=A0A397JHG0_9GLOM|nr:hypothetical protein Glove_82g60 [Diversispora epigaea]
MVSRNNILNYACLTLVQCFGLTKDPITNDYILDFIHEKNIVHRDLHSGNILYDACISEWHTSNLGLELNLQFDNINGYRPKIHKNIPQEFVTLMKLCWDVNPDNRPDENTICERIRLLIMQLFNEIDKQKNFKSKIQNILKSTKNKDKQVIGNTQTIKSINETQKIQDIKKNKKVS